MSETDDLYERAVAVVTSERKCSISLVQRRLQIGYNEAARLADRMVSEGLVSEADATGKRQIFVGGPSCS